MRTGSVASDGGVSDSAPGPSGVNATAQRVLVYGRSMTAFGENDATFRPVEVQQDRCVKCKENKPITQLSCKHNVCADCIVSQSKLADAIDEERILNKELEVLEMQYRYRQYSWLDRAATVKQKPVAEAFGCLCPKRDAVIPFSARCWAVRPVLSSSERSLAETLEVIVWSRDDNEKSKARERSAWLVASCARGMDFSAQYFSRDLGSVSLFQLAVLSLSPGVVELMLKYGVDLSHEEHKVILPWFYQKVFPAQDTDCHTPERLTMFQLLLQRGAAFTVGGRPLLGQAVQFGHINVMASLLEAGADIEERDKYGRTALFYAANGATMQMLLARGANKYIVDVRGVAPALVAIESATNDARYDLVRVCLDHHLKIDGKNAIGMSLLEMLIESQDQKSIELVASLTDCNILGFPERGEKSILMECIERDWPPAIFRTLVEVGCKECSGMNDCLRNDRHGGWTLLERACQKGNIEVISLLNDYGIDLFFSTGSRQPAIVHIFDSSTESAKKKAAEIIQWVCQQSHWKKHCISYRIGEGGRTLLMLAAVSGNYEAVRHLVEAGVSMNGKDANDKTALDLARERGRTDIVRLLLNPQQALVSTRKRSRNNGEDDAGEPPEPKRGRRFCNIL